MADQILMRVETSPNRVGKHKARNSRNYFVGLAKLPVAQNKKVDFSRLPLLRTFKNIESKCLQDLVLWSVPHIRPYLGTAINIEI